MSRLLSLYYGRSEKFCILAELAEVPRRLSRDHYWVKEHPGRLQEMAK